MPKKSEVKKPTKGKKTAAAASDESKKGGRPMGARTPETKEVADAIVKASKRKAGVQCVEIAKQFDRTGLSVLRIAESLQKQGKIRIEKVDNRLTFFKPEE